MKIRKFIFRLGVSVMCCAAPELHAQSLIWANRIGNTNLEMSESIQLDSLGNVYTIGSFYGTVDFNPGTGIFNMTSSGFSDIYVSKLDNNGNFIWARKMGGTNSDGGVSLVLDSAGNIYTTGTFAGTADFNPGTGTFNLTSAGSYDVFVTKLDNNGNFIWAKRFGGTNDQVSTSVCLDVNQQVIIGGHHSGLTDFDPGTGTFNITSAGNFDVFICKLDPGGNFQLAKSFGGVNDDRCNSVAVDNFNNIYSTGYFMNTADLDPGPAVFNVTATGTYDVYISKLDALGNFVFGLTLNGQYTDLGIQLTFDAYSNFYLCGTTEGNMDFDPGIGTFYSNASPGTQDAFIAKYSATGSFIWGGSFGSIGADIPRAITLDSLGNIYVVGDFGYTTDFDIGPGVYNMTSNNNINDNFICKYDANGNLRWARSYGGTSNEFNEAVIADEDQNLYICGEFNDVVDFEPDAGTYVLTCAGSSDAFVEKFNPCQNAVPQQLNVIACDSFIYNNQTYFSNGTYRHIFPAYPCDSVVMVNLTLNYSSHSIDSISTCDSLTWLDGITYTTNNNSAVFVTTNSQGCDSIVHLDLQIRTFTTSVDSQSSCTAYTWMDGITYYADNSSATFILTNSTGCDSVITLNFDYTGFLTVDSILSCGPVTWIDSITYTASNSSAFVVLTSALGCDSTVTLFLEIPVINDNIWQSSDTIFANSGADTYQWINCDSGFSVLPADTMHYFTSSSSGNYAVIINENGCLDTSACVFYSPLGYTTDNYGVPLVYPNPAQNSIRIQLPENSDLYSVRIINALGSCVYQNKAMSSDPGQTMEIFIEQLDEGWYVIELCSDFECSRTHFIIQR